MYIQVFNHSKRMTDLEVQIAVSACSYQLRYHAAPAWNRIVPHVVFTPTNSSILAGSYVIGIFDTSDQPGALGWHTEDVYGNVFGKVFVSPVLDNGGTTLVGNLTVASVLSHEILEAFIDPAISDWSQADDGTLYAREVGDPVENDSYVVHTGGLNVGVSNFVLPAWFDSQAKVGSRYDWLNNLHAPFTMTPGGYVVYMIAGAVQQKFGDQYPEWKLETKKSELSRTARRLK